MTIGRPARLAVLFVAIYALAYTARFPLLIWYKIPGKSFASIGGPGVLAAIAIIVHPANAGEHVLHLLAIHFGGFCQAAYIVCA